MDFRGLFSPKNGKNPQKSIAAKPGAIPVLNQETGVAGGATDAFSGISRHVNTSLKKIGSKNTEAGIGFGVGFGHGFGLGILFFPTPIIWLFHFLWKHGLALKPGMIHQFQLYLVQSMGKMITNFRVSQTLAKGILPAFMPGGTSLTNRIPPFNPTRIMMQFMGSENPINLSNNFSNESQGSESEKVVRRFLQNRALREDSKLSKIDDGLMQSENKMLHLVLKHEQLIKELVEENEKLRRILVEDLKISPDKFHSKYQIKSTSAFGDSFESRGKQRRR